MNNPQHPVSRPLGREHIPIYPRGFIAIRIVQLVLALIILGLAAFGVTYISFDGNQFILAVAVMTMLSSIYHLIAQFGVPAAHNYWVILGLDVFFVVMWLCSFALLAARVAPLFSYASSYSSSSYYYGLTDFELAWLGAQAGAAALGGVEFILYIASLIVHSIRLHRHRAAGLHSTPGTPPGPRQPNNNNNAGPVPVVLYGTDKAGNPVYAQQIPLQQQQPFPQQPVPAHLQGQPQPQFYPQMQMQMPAPGYAAVPMNAQGQPVPMPMPMQMQMPPQQHQQQGQQGQQGFYPPPYLQQQQQQQPPHQQPQQPGWGMIV
jgi:hypothetical protein